MKTEQLIDGVGTSIESSKRFNFACCDCGLVHTVVLVTHDESPIGMAVKRNPSATRYRRKKHPPKRLYQGASMNGSTPQPTIRERLTQNAEQFDQIIVDLLAENESLKQQLALRNSVTPKPETE